MDDSNDKVEFSENYENGRPIWLAGAASGHGNQRQRQPAAGCLGVHLTLPKAARPFAALFAMGIGPAT